MEQIGDFIVVVVHDVKTVNTLLDAVESGQLNVEALDGALVCSRRHLAVAVHRLTTNKYFADKPDLKTPLICAMSPKFQQSLRNISLGGRVEYTVRPPTSAVLAWSAAGNDAAASGNAYNNEVVATAIKLSGGRLGSLNDLGSPASVDVTSLCRLYGVTPEELQFVGIERAVINRLATCDT